MTLTGALADICLLQTKEILVEESNVQPVNSPVTVSDCFGSTKLG